jgi:INO80 complex subunit C
MKRGRGGQRRGGSRKAADKDVDEPMKPTKADKQGAPAAKSFKVPGTGFLATTKGTKGRVWKNLKQIINGENYDEYPIDAPTYVSVQAPPSMLPAKKYCDITGQVAKYTHPQTKLRYSEADLYQVISGLTTDQIEAYLELRGANATIK